MKRIRTARDYRFLLLFPLMVNLADAQSAVDEPSYPYVLEFRVYPYGSADFSGLYYQPDPESAPVALNVFRGRPSGLYSYEGTGVLGLFRKREEAVTMEEMAVENPLSGFEEVARHTFTAPSGERLVFITPSRGGPGSEAMDAAEFSLSDMPALADSVGTDELVFFNGTGARLAGLVGEEKVLIEAGLSDPVDLDPFYDGGKVLVGLVVQYQDSVRVVFEHRARFLPGRRNLYVLMPPQRKNSFEILAFKIDSMDFPEDVQAAEAAAGEMVGADEAGAGANP